MQLQWLAGAFNLLFAASVLAAGSLSDRLGRKRMLLLGLLVFGATPSPSPANSAHPHLRINATRPLRRTAR
jgi:MFS family permease